MNRDLSRPKNGAELLIFSVTKNCKTLNEQTHTIPKSTHAFKGTKPRDAFSFKPTNFLGPAFEWGMNKFTSY